jgi:hypothetical protein
MGWRRAEARYRTICRMTVPVALIVKVSLP